MTSVNLGQALALWINTTPPTNTKMLWYDENLVGSGVRVKYFDNVSMTWEFVDKTTSGPFRETLTTIETTITIPDQGTTDFEVEVIKYTVTGGNDGTQIIAISDKTNTSFKVTTVNGYESGVFIYRILKF